MLQYQQESIAGTEGVFNAWCLFPFSSLAASIPDFFAVIFCFRGGKPGNAISQNPLGDPLDSTNERTDLTMEGQGPSRCHHRVTKGTSGSLSTPDVSLRTIPVAIQQLRSLVTVCHARRSFCFPENWLWLFWPLPTLASSSSSGFCFPRQTFAETGRTGKHERVGWSMEGGSEGMNNKGS